MLCGLGIASLMILVSSCLFVAFKINITAEMEQAKNSWSKDNKR